MSEHFDFHSLARSCFGFAHKGTLGCCAEARLLLGSVPPSELLEIKQQTFPAGQQTHKFYQKQKFKSETLNLKSNLQLREKCKLMLFRETSFMYLCCGLSQF